MDTKWFSLPKTSQGASMRVFLFSFISAITFGAYADNLNDMLVGDEVVTPGTIVTTTAKGDSVGPKEVADLMLDEDVLSCLADLKKQTGSHPIYTADISKTVSGENENAVTVTTITYNATTYNGVVDTVTADAQLIITEKVRTLYGYPEPVGEVSYIDGCSVRVTLH
jgi:hypothetical protein